MPARRRSKWIARGVLLGFSLAFTLGLLEVGLRVIGFEAPVTMQPDPHYGFAHAPRSAWTHRTEGFSHVTTNELGFCDKTWTDKKPANGLRIAVLGDSFIEGMQVARSDRVTERLQATLQSHPAFQRRSVEVLNFACSGYGTGQELQVFRHAVKPFHADVVILGLFTGNDIRNNSRELEGDPRRPYFVLQDGELKLDESFQAHRVSLTKRLAIGATKVSRLAQAGYAVAQRASHASDSSTQTDVNQQLQAEGLYQPGLMLDVFQAPRSEEWTAAWKVTEALVTQLRNEVEASGAEFYVVSLTNSVQVHPDSAKRERFREITQVDDLFYPDRRLAEHCRAQRIPYLMLVEPMQRHAEREKVFLHGFANADPAMGHWNEHGHAAASQFIADWLLKETSFGEVAQLPRGE